MKKIWKKYCGVIMLYSVVFFGILAINARCKYLNELEIQKENYNIVAMGDIYER